MPIWIISVLHTERKTIAVITILKSLVNLNNEDFNRTEQLI